MSTISFRIFRYFLFVSTLFFISPVDLFAATANRFFYPLEVWNVVVQDREHLGGGVYHAGIDAGVELPAGAPVYAIAAGTVQEVQERSLFGEVILIEHTLEEGDRIVSLYGHLWPNKSVVSPGETVKAGQYIGVLGNKKNNGGWVVHLHFGIHKEPYTGEWKYWGHLTDKKLLKKWFDTDTFLADYAAKLPSKKIRSPKHVLALQGMGDKRIVRLYKENGKTEKVHLTRAQENSLSDIFVADIDKNGVSNIIGVGNSTENRTEVMIFSKKGRLSYSFPVFPKKMTDGARLALGDVDGDGMDEVIVASGKKMNERVKIFEIDGTLKTTLIPFPEKMTRKGLDVATGDVDGDGIDEIIVSKRDGKALVTIMTETGVKKDTFRAYEKKHLSGVNITAGDVDSDGMDEIITAPNGDRLAQVRVFDRRLRSITRFNRLTDISYIPFSQENRSAVDVSIVDWENDGKKEIQVSMMGSGETRIKTYRYNEKKTLLYDRVLRGKIVNQGARIAGWNEVETQ